MRPRSRNGVLLPGCELQARVIDALEDVANDAVLADGDTICLTESVVARSQINYVMTNDIAQEIEEKCFLSPNQTIGVLFPITSRNRFVPISKGIGRVIPRGPSSYNSHTQLMKSETERFHRMSQRNSARRRAITFGVATSKGAIRTR